MKTIKRQYHPLVMYSFYAGILKDEQLKIIPNSTLSYWRSFNHKSFFGYEWVRDYIETDIQTKDVAKRKVGITVIRFVGKMYKCYDQLLSDTKSFKRVIKKNAGVVVATIDKMNGYIQNLKLCCKLIKLSVTQYYRLKNKINCTVSVLNLCYKTHPSQLSITEASIITDCVTKPDNFYQPLCSLYYSLMRTGKLFCSLSTFYKYASLILEKREKPIREIAQNSFRAFRVFEYLHIDTTFVLTQKEGSSRVAFVKDNRSKALLHKAIVPDGKSGYIRDLLKATFEKYSLFNTPVPINIVSDGGSENKGEVLEWIRGLNNDKVIKLTAKDNFAHSNNMVESLNNVFKNEFLRDKNIHDQTVLQKELDAFDNYYNWNRYPFELYGYSPMEVVEGAVPGKNRFKDEIQKAQQKRYLLNKVSTYCGICS
jgi:hypothetical protein